MNHFLDAILSMTKPLIQPTEEEKRTPENYVTIPLTRVPDYNVVRLSGGTIGYTTREDGQRYVTPDAGERIRLSHDTEVTVIHTPVNLARECVHQHALRTQIVCDLNAAKHALAADPENPERNDQYDFLLRTAQSYGIELIEVNWECFPSIRGARRGNACPG
jgi:hypothetical protein